MISIGVVVPVYNSEDKIIKVLNSILSQEGNYEILICAIDDCSFDSSLEKIKSINNKRIIVLKNNVNLGVAKTRNKGIKYLKLKHPNIEYFAFCDSDDIWRHDKLNKQLIKDTSFSYSDFINYNWSEGKKLNYMKSKLVEKFDDCLSGNPFPLSSVIIRSSFLKFDVFPDLYHEDYRAWLTICSQKDFFKDINYVKEPLMLYGCGENSLTSNKIKSFFGYLNIISSLQIDPKVKIISIFKYLFYQFTRKRNL